jgi:Glycosidases
MSKSIIYQILPRLFNDGSVRRSGLVTGHFSDIDRYVLSYIKSLGVTHVWYTGVIRHATTVAFPRCKASDPQIVKGAAGSPYAMTDYYDVNPYMADVVKDRMFEFEQLLSRTHEAGMKVVIDFVPNHVSRDYGRVGLVRKDVEPLGASDDTSVHWRPENDFFYYPGEFLNLPCEGGYREFPAKASGNCFSPSPGINDWYETVKINYCDFHTETWDKMYDIVRFWCLKGVDAFRCDMVEMVPWQFFKWLISNIKAEFPEVSFIAEVYSKDLYRLYIEEVGFDYLYDKSGKYDTVRSVVEGYSPARSLTSCWQSLGNLQPHLLDFLENHDEQRFASDFFGKDASRTFAALGFSLLWSSSPFMVYSGEELGERGMDCEGFSGLDGRTTIFDWWSPASARLIIEYSHGGNIPAREQDLLGRWKQFLTLASSNKAFTEGGNYDLCWCNSGTSGFNSDKYFAFLRGNAEQVFLVVCNFSEETACMDIFIPSDAFACLGNERTETTLRCISVPSFDCLVLPV